MIIYATNPTTGRVTQLDEADTQSVEASIRILRAMRWAKVKRFGRRGQRGYRIEMRNRAEWRRGHIEVDGARVTLA